jgi:hypothetical protein
MDRRVVIAQLDAFNRAELVHPACKASPGTARVFIGFSNQPS